MKMSPAPVQSTTKYFLNWANETFQQPQFRNGLALIGLVWTITYILSKLLKAGNAVRIYFLSRIFEKSQNWLNLGKWAVVTGSTDGTGKEFARQLAAQGLNIILISRNPEKLQKVGNEISREFNVETKTIPINFTHALPSTYTQLQEELKDLDIGLLVNNVGVYVPYPMPFDSLTEENVWDHVVVNCGAVTMMTKIILPQMKLRKRGGIINISSCGAIYPIPLVSSYSATKIYIDYLTEALQQENEKYGITFLNLNPFSIATNMIKFYPRFREPSFFAPSPEHFVKSALRTFGKTKKTAGCFPHAIQRGIFEISPVGFRWLVDAFNKILWKEGEKNDVKSK